MKKKIFNILLIFISFIIIMILGISIVNALPLVSQNENYVDFACKGDDWLMKLDPSQYVKKKLGFHDSSGNFVDGYAGSHLSGNIKSGQNFNRVWCIHYGDKSDSAINLSSDPMCITNIIDLTYDNSGKFYVKQTAYNGTTTITDTNTSKNYLRLVRVISSKYGAATKMYVGRYILARKTAGTVKSVRGLGDNSTNGDSSTESHDLYTSSNSYINSNFDYNLKVSSASGKEIKLQANGTNKYKLEGKVSNSGNYDTKKYSITGKSASGDLTIGSDGKFTIDVSEQLKSNLKNKDELVLTFTKKVRVARIFIVENNWLQQRTIVAHGWKTITHTVKYSIDKEEESGLELNMGIMEVHSYRLVGNNAFEVHEDYNWENGVYVDEGDRVIVDYKIRNKKERKTGPTTLSNIFAFYNSNLLEWKADFYGPNTVWSGATSDARTFTQRPDVFKTFDYESNTKYGFNVGKYVKSFLNNEGSLKDVPMSFMARNETNIVDLEMYVKGKYPKDVGLDTGDIADYNPSGERIPVRIGGNIQNIQPAEGANEENDNSDYVQFNFKSIWADFNKTINSINGTDINDYKNWCTDPDDSSKKYPLVRQGDNICYNLEIINTGKLPQHYIDACLNDESKKEIYSVGVSNICKYTFHDTVPWGLKLDTIDGADVSNKTTGKITRDTYLIEYIITRDDNGRELYVEFDVTYKDKYGLNFLDSDTITVGYVYAEPELALYNNASFATIGAVGQIDRLYNRNDYVYHRNIGKIVYVCAKREPSAKITKKVKSVNERPRDECALADMCGYPIVKKGDVVEFAISVTNNGLEKLKDFNISDKLDSLLTINSVNGLTSSGTDENGNTITISDQDVSVTIAQTLDLQETSKEIIVQCTVGDVSNEEYRKAIVNTAYLTSAKKVNNDPCTITDDDSDGVYFIKVKLDVDIEKNVYSVKSNKESEEVGNTLNKETISGYDKAVTLIQCGDIVRYAVTIKNTSNTNDITRVDFEENIPTYRDGNNEKKYFELTMINNTSVSESTNNAGTIDGITYEIKNKVIKCSKENANLEKSGGSLTVYFEYKTNTNSSQIGKIIANTAVLNRVDSTALVENENISNDSNSDDHEFDSDKSGTELPIIYENINKIATAHVKVKNVKAKIEKTVVGSSSIDYESTPCTVKYKLKVSNEQDSVNLYTAVVKEEIPSGLSDLVIKDSNNNAVIYETDNQFKQGDVYVSFNVSNLLINTSQEFYLEYTLSRPNIPPSSSKSISNTAYLSVGANRNDKFLTINSVSTATINIGGGINPLNATIKEVVYSVNGSTTLEKDKDDYCRAECGDTVIYKVTITNTGDGSKGKTIKDLTFSEEFNENTTPNENEFLTFVSASGGNVTYSADDTGRILNCTLSNINLAYGSSVDIYFTYTVNQLPIASLAVSGGVKITNTATLKTITASDESKTLNLPSSVDIKLKRMGARIKKEITEPNPIGTDKLGNQYRQVFKGDRITYKITVENRGNYGITASYDDSYKNTAGTIYNAVFTEDIPTGLELCKINGNPVNSSGSTYILDGLKYKVSGNSVTCTITNAIPFESGGTFGFEEVYFEYEVTMNQNNIMKDTCKKIKNTVKLKTIDNRNDKTWNNSKTAYCYVIMLGTLEEPVGVSIDKKVTSVMYGTTDSNRTEDTAIYVDPETGEQIKWAEVKDYVTYEITVKNTGSYSEEDLENGSYSIDGKQLKAFTLIEDIPYGLSLNKVGDASISNSLTNPTVTGNTDGFTFTINDERNSVELAYSGDLDFKDSKSILLEYRVNYPAEEIGDDNPIIVNTVKVDTIETDDTIYSSNEYDDAKIILRRLGGEILKNVKSVYSSLNPDVTASGTTYRYVKDVNENTVLKSCRTTQNEYYVDYRIRVMNTGSYSRSEIDLSNKDKVGIIREFWFEEEIPEGLELVSVDGDVVNHDSRLDVLLGDPNDPYLNYRLQGHGSNTKVIVYVYGDFELGDYQDVIFRYKVTASDETDIRNIATLTRCENRNFAVVEPNQKAAAYIYVKPCELGASITKTVSTIDNNTNFEKTTTDNYPIAEKGCSVVYNVGIQNTGKDINTSKAGNVAKIDTINFTEQIPTELTLSSIAGTALTQTEINNKSCTRRKFGMYLEF